MKKISSLLPLSGFVVLLLSVLIFSCQKTELKPEKNQALIDQSPEFQTASDLDAECKLFFKELTEEEEEELEQMGLNEFLKERNLDGIELTASSSSSAQYCNYVITQIYDKGTCGPSIMDGFCVSCPGSCKFSGVLWSPNGYRARAVRSHILHPVTGCKPCHEGVIYPRG